MALPPLADVTALGARLEGGLPTEDYDRAAALLDDVSAEVRAATGSTFTTAAGDLDAPDIVPVVTVRAALRAWLNPRGVVSETIEDYTYRLPGGAGLVFLGAGEVATLRAAGLMPPEGSDAAPFAGSLPYRR